MKKLWNAVLDEHTCGICRAHHGYGGTSLPKCTNPNGCRCVALDQARCVWPTEEDVDKAIEMLRNTPGGIGFAIDVMRALRDKVFKENT